MATALATIILEKIEFTEEEKKYLDDNLEKVGIENFENCLMTFLMKSVQIKFSSIIKKTAANSLARSFLKLNLLIPLINFYLQYYLFQ